MFPRCTCEQAGPSALWEGQWLCTACYFKQANIAGYGCGDELSGNRKHRRRGKCSELPAQKRTSLSGLWRQVGGMGKRIPSLLRRV